jgi:hypothetical protein
LQCCRHDAAGGVVDVPSLEPTADNRPSDAHDALELFGASVERNTYGSETTFSMPDDDEGLGSREPKPSEDDEDHRRGPGRPARTTGADDARAPRYWTVEAERIVLALVESGHRVTSDDLRERFADEPSATGAAIGSLFKRMAARGQLVLVGHRPSTRPEARGRVVGLWAAGAPS